MSSNIGIPTTAGSTSLTKIAQKQNKQASNVSDSQKADFDSKLSAKSSNQSVASKDPVTQFSSGSKVAKTSEKTKYDSYLLDPNLSDEDKMIFMLTDSQVRNMLNPSKRRLEKN